MQTQYFTLPEWNFVGGETQTRIFKLYEPNEIYVMNLQGSSSEVSVTDFVNPEGNASFIKPAVISEDESGKACYVTVSFTPNDTISMNGKYIYQITIRDIKGNVAAPRGVMRISQNIDQAFSLG